MKKALLNQLKIEKLERCSPDEIKKIIKTLKEKYNMSYRKISEVSGISHTTIHGWVHGKKYKTKDTHMALATLITKIREYEIKTEIELQMLKNLKKIINDKLNSIN